MKEFYVCDKCGKDGLIVIRELERHDNPLGQAYEILECGNCHIFYKIYWEFKRKVMLKEFGK